MSDDNPRAATAATLTDEELAELERLCREATPWGDGTKEPPTAADVDEGGTPLHPPQPPADGAGTLAQVLHDAVAKLADTQRRLGAAAELCRDAAAVIAQDAPPASGCECDRCQSTTELLAKLLALARSRTPAAGDAAAELYRMADAAKAKACEARNAKLPGADNLRGRATGLKMAADYLSGDAAPAQPPERPEGREAQIHPAAHGSLLDWVCDRPNAGELIPSPQPPPPQAEALAEIRTMDFAPLVAQWQQEVPDGKPNLRLLLYWASGTIADQQRRLDAAEAEAARLREALGEISRHATAHHAGESAHVVFHSLVVDIPAMCEKALASPPARAAGGE